MARWIALFSLVAAAAQAETPCTAAAPKAVLKNVSDHRFVRLANNRARESGRFPDGTEVVVATGGCVDGIEYDYAFLVAGAPPTTLAAAAQQLAAFIASHAGELASTTLTWPMVSRSLREVANSTLPYRRGQVVCEQGERYVNMSEDAAGECFEAVALSFSSSGRGRGLERVKLAIRHVLLL